VDKDERFALDDLRKASTFALMLRLGDLAEELRRRGVVDQQLEDWLNVRGTFHVHGERFRGVVALHALPTTFPDPVADECDDRDGDTRR
jgi:hypothetical protein